MIKIAVAYWSGTGNTETMAVLVAEGIKETGAEKLEDSKFEPMFSSCKNELKGIRIALFGSYGWGDGEWMRDWEETCIFEGAIMVCDSVICNESPDNEASIACKSLGAILAKA